MATTHRPRQPGGSLAHQVVPRITKFEPIPADYKTGRTPPFQMNLADVLTEAEVTEIQQSGSMTFHCLGDTGGVKNPEPQKLVARGLEQSLKEPLLSTTLRGAGPAPTFCYHIGDVVYYNGEVDKYYDQFYEPYEHYPLPIVAIPGNHDGEPVDQNATTLEGFYRNFLATPAADKTPVYTSESRDSGRAAMHQPFFYRTLITPFATFIGLYSNVPEHGQLDPDQRALVSRADARRRQEQSAGGGRAPSNLLVRHVSQRQSEHGEGAGGCDQHLRPPAEHGIERARA